MKKKFSTSWKGSKNPGKQRKYIANAPLHLKIKLLSTNLSKALRTKHGKRSLNVRKGDVVKITKGKFKGKQGKVTQVKTKKSKIYVEGIQAKKMDGSKVNVPLRAPNLQIIELNLDDKKRLKSKKEIQKTKTENSAQKEDKKTEKEKSKNKENKK